jgi:cobalt-zinc-cadmium efflux system outer membrane protein
VERGRAAVALDAQRESSVRASLALTHLLGLAVPVEPSDSLRRAEAPVLNSDSLLQHALSRRPDALAARQALELTDANERLQAALAKPSVTIALDALVQQGQQMYGPSVSLPWAHFDRNQGEREKARVRRAAARYDVEVTERRIRLEVEEALAIVRLRTATLARFDDGGSEGIVQRAQSATAAAEFAYRNGATSLVELLDAERSYDEVRRAHAEAIADYNKSLVLLSNVTWQVPEGQK